MKITSEKHIELAPGFYWAVGIEKSLFNGAVKQVGTCIVYVKGSRPFLEYEVVGGPVLAGEVHIYEQAEAPECVAKEIEQHRAVRVRIAE